jgi:hypothetical protein
MFKPPYAAAITAVLITLAGGPFGLGEAHARAIYTGTFDPENEFYKWEGTHAFSVDEACLDGNGWKAVNGNNFYDMSEGDVYSCGEVRLTDGSLTLEDKAAGVKRTRTFASFLGEGGYLTSGIWGIYVKDGQLAGVDTDLLGSVGFRGGDEPLNNHDWFLRWESGKAPVDAYSVRSQSLASDGLYQYTYLQSPDDPVYLSRCTDSACILATEKSATPTFNRVPEPGGLALVAMALIAAGIGTRRTRRP